MKVIYKNKKFSVVEGTADGLLLEDRAGTQFEVLYSDQNLIVDPTDEQWEQAEE